MSHNNHITEVKIVLILKKNSIFGTNNFEGYSFPQETQNSIRVLRLITFGRSNSLQKIPNFVGVLGLKTFKDYSIPQN